MNLMHAVNRIDYEIYQRYSHDYLKPILKIDSYNFYPNIIISLELRSPFNKGVYTCNLFHSLKNDKKENESFYSYIKNKMDKIEKQFEELNSMQGDLI